MLPVVVRELSVAARRRGTYSIRVVATVFTIALMLWLVLLGGAIGSAATQGKAIFTVLSSVAFGYSLLAGMRATADSLSAEKREGTLGLLFLTDLKGHDVVLGKLVSSSLACFYGLLAIVPMLALALLMGGVSLTQVARVSLVLTNTMFFSLAAGLFASTFHQHERKAMLATFVLIAFLTVFPGILVIFVNEVLDAHLSDEAEAIMLLPSPLLSFMLTFSPGPWSPSPISFLAA